jgi:hypothetical protein
VTGRFWRLVHFWLMVLWVVLAVPTFVLWLNSVPWLVFMSWYAIVVGQFGAWQAARIEEKAEESGDTSTVAGGGTDEH